MAGDWTNEQNDAIVADYFAMLAEDIAGRPYSKASHNRILQAVTGRPRGSIEYKHQNISAVLKGLGEDWIPATSRPSTFKPRSWTRWCAGLNGTPLGLRRQRVGAEEQRPRQSATWESCGSARRRRTATLHRRKNSNR